MNNAICLSTTLFFTRVVVGGWKKSFVLSIQIRELRYRPLYLRHLCLNEDNCPHLKMP